MSTCVTEYISGVTKLVAIEQNVRMLRYEPLPMWLLRQLLELLRLNVDDLLNKKPESAA